MTNGSPGYTPAQTREKIAANLSAEMTRARWSGRRMADALGLTQAYVARRASGEVELSGSDIDLFAGFLGVPVTALFVNREPATVIEIDQARIAERQTKDYRSDGSLAQVTEIKSRTVAPVRGVPAGQMVAVVSELGRAGQAATPTNRGIRA